MITAAAPNQRGVIDALHDRFVRQGGAAVGSELPIHARWTNILQYVPAMRGHHLTEDLSALYADAEKNFVGTQLDAVCDLVVLQLTYYDFLRNNGIGFAHVMRYMLESADSWGIRLYARADITKPWRRAPGRTGVRKPVKPKINYGWLQ